MKKLKSVALYSLLAPAITLSAGSVLAQQQGAQPGAQPGGQQETRQTTPQTTPQQERQGTQQETRQGTQQETRQQTTQGTQAGRQDTPPTAGQPGAQQTGRTPGQQPGMDQEYLSAAPQNAVYADRLMGSDVRTTDDENVGSVNDLIFDEDGQLMAVVVGVGGFLGMGEKDVAINWNSITRDPQDRDVLRIDATEDQLRSAPEFRGDRD